MENVNARTETLNALKTRIAQIDTTVRNDTMGATGETYKRYTAVDRWEDAALIKAAKRRNVIRAARRGR